MVGYKNILILLLLTLFLFGCREKVVEETYPNGKPKIVNIYKKIKGERVKVEGTRFYDDGKKEVTGKFDPEGKKDGHWTYWYKDGKVWSECDFQSGKKSGMSTVYFDNGQKRYEGMYENDKQIGIWRFWDESGKLVQEKEY